MWLPVTCARAITQKNAYISRRWQTRVEKKRHPHLVWNVEIITITITHRTHSQYRRVFPLKQAFFLYAFCFLHVCFIDGVMIWYFFWILVDVHCCSILWFQTLFLLGIPRKKAMKKKKTITNTEAWTRAQTMLWCSGVENASGPVLESQ